jgi:hypothetical protein
VLLPPLVVTPKSPSVGQWAIQGVSSWIHDPTIA